MMEDVLAELKERVRAAAAAKTPLNLVGGGTKAWYGEAPRGEPLALAPYRGIVAYEPTELVVTARCGTSLAELEATLAERRQMLAFEPPHFGESATLGGCVAAGLSGPRRAAAGGVRDFVLGVRWLNAAGEAQSFGGQVMKNVAGYDVSRVLAGSLGTLGVILEVSLKVVPQPAAELTLCLDCAEDEALAALNHWAGQALPITASAWMEGRLTLRLAGSDSAVQAARRRLGGERVDHGGAFWRAVREHTHRFFDLHHGLIEPGMSGARLWRLSVPSAAPTLGLPGRTLVEWGGAQRWLVSGAAAEVIRRRAAQAGGHATLYRGDKRDGVFHPLAPGVARLHHRLKQAFDPLGIFNPGRMFADF